MHSNKGHIGAILQRAIFKLPLFFVLALLNPGIPEARSNVCPVDPFASIAGAVNHYDGLSSLTPWSGGWEAGEFPRKVRHPASPAIPRQPADDCYFKENLKGTADRGHEPALPVFCGIFLGYHYTAISSSPDLPFVIISPWTGESNRIRPPPVS